MPVLFTGTTNHQICSRLVVLNKILYTDKNGMKVKLSSVAEGIEFQRDESRSFLKTSTGEVVLITDEEINAAEIDDDVSAGADWYIDAVKRAKELINNEQDYICLPSKYDFNEYRIIERFILTLLN